MNKMAFIAWEVVALWGLRAWAFRGLGFLGLGLSGALGFLGLGLSGAWAFWALGFLGLWAFWGLGFLGFGLSGLWAFWGLGFPGLGLSGLWAFWATSRRMSIQWLSRDIRRDVVAKSLPLQSLSFTKPFPFKALFLQSPNSTNQTTNYFPGCVACCC